MYVSVPTTYARKLISFSIGFRFVVNYFDVSKFLI